MFIIKFDLNSLQAKIKSNQNETNSLKESISELENKNSYLNGKNEELIKSLEDSSNRNESLQHEIKKKENQIASLYEETEKNEIHSLKEKNGKLIKTVEEKAKENNLLKREIETIENEINVLKEEIDNDSEIQLREYELDGNEFMLKTPSRKMERIVSKRLPKIDSICEQKSSLSMIQIPFFEKESSGDEFKQPTLVTSKNTSIESIHAGSPMCEISHLWMKKTC
jgi:chromosome segregation ATPase